MLKPLNPAAYQLFHEGILALADVEHNGMRIDVEYLHSAIEKLDRRIERSTKELREFEEYACWRRAYGQKTNLDSRPQLAHVLFDLMGFEGGSKSESGKWKADEEAFQDMDNEFIRLYIKRTKLLKLRGTYLAGIKRELVGDHVHVNFGLNVARTYRGNCSDFNAQNLPIRDPFMGKMIRKCFIPEEDHVIIEMDYGQLEVRIAAPYHKDPVMISYLKDPSKCMHRDTASDLFLCKPDQVSKDVRYCAKNMFVFPEFYGSWFAQCAPNLWAAMSRMKLMVGDTPAKEWLAKHKIKKLGELPPKSDESWQGWEPEQGSFLKHVQKVERTFWDSRFKVYNAWKRSWYDEYLKTGGFNFLTGFRVQGWHSRNDVINYPVQGAAFHCLLWSLIQLNKRLKKYKMKSKIICQIHDSIIASVHYKEVKQYRQMAEEIMTQEILEHWKWINVPLIAEAEGCERGQTWYDKKPLAV